VNQTVIEDADYEVKTPEPGTKLAKITDAIDKRQAGQLSIANTGVQFNDMLQVMEFAKMMSTAGQAIQPYLRQNPGACLAVTVQAVEWGMSPFAVANKVYFVNDRIGYESQLVHALVETRAPLERLPSGDKRRLNVRYHGEGAEMYAVVYGILRGEDEPREYQTPAIKDIKVKNSPLWTSDPKQQLFYYASRGWARRFVPDILLGIYTPDEIETMPPVEQPKPSVVERLAQKTIEGEPVVHAEGFKPDNVEKAAPRKGRSGEKGKSGEKELPNSPEPASGSMQAEKPAASVPTEAADKEAAPAPQETATAGQGGDKTPPEPQTQPELQLDAQAAGSANPEPPTGPKTEEEYAAYARAWFATMPNATETHARWTSERKLRRDCGVSGSMLETLQDEMERVEFEG
jgi:hypothetical protein